MSTALIITNNLDSKPINTMHYGWSGSRPAAIAELQNIILYMRNNKKVHTKYDLNCLFFKLSKGLINTTETLSNTLRNLILVMMKQTYTHQN